MKKLLLGLGSIASVVAPLAAVISCGDDDKNTNAGNNGTAPVALDTAKQTALSTAANSALGMTTADVDTVAKATNYAFTTKVEDTNGNFVDKNVTFKNAVVYNLKSSVTTITMNYGSTTVSQATDAGGQVIVGVSETTVRAAATPHLYILMKFKVGGGDMQTLTEVTDATTLAAVKKDIMDPVFAPAADTTTVDLKTELDKFASATSTKTEAELKTALGNDTTVDTTKLGIPAVTLGTGVTATLTIPAAYASGPLTVTVTLAKSGATNVSNNTKTITVTPKAATSGGTGSGGGTTAVDLKTELDKFASATSTKTEAELKTALGNDTTVDTTKLGIGAVTLGTGVTAILTIPASYTSGPLTVTVTLAKSGASSVSNNTKTITVTPKAAAASTVDLSADLAKFVDATSTKTEAELVTALASNTTVTAADLGISPSSSLTTDVTASFTITAYAGTGNISAALTLTTTAGTASNNTKTITVTPKATDLKTELDKFADVTSTVNQATLASTTASKTTGLTMAELGLPTTITLGTDVTATFSIPAAFGATDTTVTVTVTLTKADTTILTNNTKTFVLTVSP